MKINNFSTCAALFAVALSICYSTSFNTATKQSEKLEITSTSIERRPERQFADAVVTIESETLFPLSDFDAANSSLTETNFVVPMKEPEVVMPETMVDVVDAMDTISAADAMDSTDMTGTTFDFWSDEFIESVEDEGLVPESFETEESFQEDYPEEGSEMVNPDDVYRAFFEAYGISPFDEVRTSTPATYEPIEAPAPVITAQAPEPDVPVDQVQEIQPEIVAQPEPELGYDYYQVQDGSYIDPALIDEAYLAGLIKTEAGGVANQNGKVGVGLTVLSRMQSDVYPDDMHAVIDQKYQYATPSRHYSESDLEAARTAVELWNGDNNNVLPEDVMYFFGDGKENYFYRQKPGGGVEFFPVPGQTLPDNIEELYRRIVLKR